MDKKIKNNINGRTINSLRKSHTNQTDGVHMFHRKCAESLQNAAYVEIGAWIGESAVIACNQDYITSVVSIDPYLGVNGDGIPFEDLEQLYYENTKDYDVSLIKKKSDAAVKSFEDASIDILYVDGQHDYRGVKLDLENYYPKVKKGGIIGCHDYTHTNWPGVKKAVDGFLVTHNLKISEIFPDSTCLIYI